MRFPQPMAANRKRRTKSGGDKPAPCSTPADAFVMLRGSVLGHDDIVAPDHDAWSTDGGPPRSS